MQVIGRDGVLSPAIVELVRWRTSSRSDGGGGNCVEVGPLADGTGRVALRHSRQPTGPVIVYDAAEWAAFVAGVRSGEFDFSAD